MDDGLIDHARGRGVTPMNKDGCNAGDRAKHSAARQVWLGNDQTLGLQQKKQHKT